MVCDLENEDLKSISHVPQDLDGPIEHPGISTTRDGELEREGTGMNDQSIEAVTESDSIHSQSRSADAALDDPNQLNIERSKSRSSSTRSRPLVIVPISERRGLFARLTFVVPEVEKPYYYKRSTKWFITFLVAIAAAAAPMGSSILLREYPLSLLGHLLKSGSCTTGAGHRLAYRPDHHESVSSNVYALNVHLSTLVVFVF